jgi:hypothetical protein
MPRMIYATGAALAAALFSAAGAQALPAASKPTAEAAALHKTQGFGIYIGPGYDYYGPRYRYADPYYYDGYPYYSRYYYDRPRRYYYYNQYRGDRRAFRRLQRRAP